MKGWQQTLFGILVGLLVAAGILVILRSPGGEGINLLPAPTAKPMVVHISGEVNQPGVYEIPQKSRIFEVITAAGGFTQDADVDALNQADFVQDGSKIVIPALQDTIRTNTTTYVATPANSTSADLININTASQTELENLPGIGATRADDIISYRLVNGKFQRIEDIMKVPGIGSTTFENIKNLIVIE